MSHDAVRCSISHYQAGADHIFNMADGREFFACECFFTHNIFLKNYEAHIVFESEEQFQCDYRKVCSSFRNLTYRP